jgi:AraC-like DNA-binding protein
VEHLESGSPPDRLFMQEDSLQVLRRTLMHTFSLREGDEEHNPVQRDLAHDTRKLLSSRFRENWSLDESAGQLSYSPYHLSRVFRKVTGTTIHQYRNELRLRTALEEVSSQNTRQGCGLTSLAHRLGYSSRSHFSMAFRKAFKLPPTQIGRLHGG